MFQADGSHLAIEFGRAVSSRFALRESKTPTDALPEGASDRTKRQTSRFALIAAFTRE